MRRTLAVLTAIAMLTLMSGPASSALATRDAEPVKLFAFDVEPGCLGAHCVADGAFYPGTAQRAGSSFSGEPLTVQYGSDVEFTNISSEHHNIVSFAKRGGHPLFESDEHVMQGMTSLMFTSHLKPGTYAYYCGHHPTNMFGLIKIAK